MTLLRQCFQLNLSIWKQRSLFFEIRAPLNKANKFCETLLRMAFRNCKLEVLRFFTEKGADVSVRDIKTTVLFTSLLHRIVLILSSFYWVQERLLN